MEGVNRKSGIRRKIKAEIGVPVVSSLTPEPTRGMLPLAEQAPNLLSDIPREVQIRVQDRMTRLHHHGIEGPLPCGEMPRYI